jgi:type II secretory pathway pseudopilin PulG
MLTRKPRTAVSVRWRRKAVADDSAGFTIIELSVAMTISITLLLMMASIVTSDTKAESSLVNSANSASNVRLVFMALQNDIQSANPLSTLSTLNAYNDELQMTIQPANQVVTWQYSYTTQVVGGYSYFADDLTRQVGTSTPDVELTNVTNGDPNPPNTGIPVFSYYDHCLINLVTESEATPASVSGTATAVQVTLSVANVNSAPYGSTTTVHIMDKPPVASQCG